MVLLLEIEHRAHGSGLRVAGRAMSRGGPVAKTGDVAAFPMTALQTLDGRITTTDRVADSGFVATKAERRGVTGLA